MKKVLYLLGILCITFVTSFSFLGCKKDTKKNMVSKSDDIVWIEITDNRSVSDNKIKITDEDKIKVFRDKMLKISGTKMKTKLQGTFPNQYYSPDFPTPIFKIDVAYSLGENSYGKYTIIGGQKIPVYSPGTGTRFIDSYTYDYNYICKRVENSGYENVKDGPGLEFYTQLIAE